MSGGFSFSTPSSSTTQAFSFSTPSSTSGFSTSTSLPNPSSSFSTSFGPTQQQQQQQQQQQTKINIKTQFVDLPNEIKTQLQDFANNKRIGRNKAEQAIKNKEFKESLDDLGRTTETLQTRLSSINYAIDCDLINVQMLKRDVMQELANAETAQSNITKMSSSHFYIQRDYVSSYFQGVAVKLEERAQELKKQIEEIADALSYAANTQTSSGTMLQDTLKAQQESFLISAARVAALHAQVNDMRDAFLEKYDVNDDFFKDKPRKKMLDDLYSAFKYQEGVTTLPGLTNPTVPTANTGFGNTGATGTGFNLGTGSGTGSFGFGNPSTGTTGFGTGSTGFGTTGSTGTGSSGFNFGSTGTGTGGGGFGFGSTGTTGSGTTGGFGFGTGTTTGSTGFGSTGTTGGTGGFNFGSGSGSTGTTGTGSAGFGFGSTGSGTGTGTATGTGGFNFGSGGSTGSTGFGTGTSTGFGSTGGTGSGTTGGFGFGTGSTGTTGSGTTGGFGFGTGPTTGSTGFGGTGGTGTGTSNSGFSFSF